MLRLGGVNREIVEVDVSDLDNIASYLDGKSDVSLKITGVGEIAINGGALREYLSSRDDLFLDIDVNINGSIGISSFHHLNNIVKAKISATAIGGAVFSSCENLEYVHILAKTAGDGSFTGCVSLKEIVVDNINGLIINNFLSGASSLTKATFDNNITAVGSNSFNGCIALKYLHFENTHNEPIINSGAFLNVPLDCIVYVAEDYPSDTFGPFTNVIKVKTQ